MYLKYKNLRQIKTTVIGLALIAAGVYYIFHSDNPETIIVFGILGIGFSMLFMPDKLLEGLENFINNNKNKEI